MLKAKLLITKNFEAYPLLKTIVGIKCPSWQEIYDNYRKELLAAGGYYYETKMAKTNFRFVCKNYGHERGRFFLACKIHQIASEVNKFWA